MKRRGHRIRGVAAGSIAEELELEPGDRLLSVNGKELEDIFDYQYLTEDEYVVLAVEKASGEEWELEIEKGEDEDIGLTFENGLMDDYRSCANRCVFCFIDQMPPGMRETLYFKDDDSRLSFLQGNYVTLTNMKQREIDRVIRFHLSPINISVHTTNPKLRCEMLNNRFAGKVLSYLDQLYDAGISMNGQIVLCPGLNDGPELEHTIEDLTRYLPRMQSVSVVPVGLTKYREGLYPLRPVDAAAARSALEIIEKWRDKIYPQYGTHFVHASDEIYLMAGAELPEEAAYDGYPQLENGVGMLRLLIEETQTAIREAKETYSSGRQKTESGKSDRQRISAATGRLAAPVLGQLLREISDAFPDVSATVYPIDNRFFGEMITVSGLLTGQDILAQLKGKDLGDRLLLPENLLRRGEQVFLDDMTVKELEDALQIPIAITGSGGQELVDAVLGRKNDTGSSRFRPYEPEGNVNGYSGGPEKERNGEENE